MSQFIILRSTIFNLLSFCNSIFFSLTGLVACFVLPYRLRYAYITGWSRVMIFLSREICGIHYNIKGLEHAPKVPCIVACSHQSAWETIALQLFLPPQTWVIKRELLLVPFFGWGLGMLKPVAIHRRSSKASDQFARGALKRLKEGLWVIVFPEGTRQAPKTLGFIKKGAAHVAFETGVPLLPIVHNAGNVWPKNSWLKYPGTIQVIIEPALLPSQFPDKDAMWKALQEKMAEMFKLL